MRSATRAIRSSAPLAAQSWPRSASSSSFVATRRTSSPSTCHPSVSLSCRSGQALLLTCLRFRRIRCVRRADQAADGRAVQAPRAFQAEIDDRDHVCGVCCSCDERRADWTFGSPQRSSSCSQSVTRIFSRPLLCAYAETFEISRTGSQGLQQSRGARHSLLRKAAPSLASRSRSIFIQLLLESDEVRGPGSDSVSGDAADPRLARPKRRRPSRPFKLLVPSSQHALKLPT